MVTHTIYYQHPRSMPAPTREYIIANGSGLEDSFGPTPSLNEASYELTFTEYETWRVARFYGLKHAFDKYDNDRRIV